MTVCTRYLSQFSPHLSLLHHGIVLRLYVIANTVTLLRVSSSLLSLILHLHYALDSQPRSVWRFAVF